MTLPRYFLERVELPTETLGSMYGQLPERVMIAKSMELVWRNNQVGQTADTASCIPYGIHVFEKMPPNEGRRYGHFRARAIEGRTINKAYKDRNGKYMSRVLIHPITYVKDLLGCIGVGSRFADINGDGVPDMEGSKAKLLWMYDTMPDVFELEIIKKP